MSMDFYVNQGGQEMAFTMQHTNAVTVTTPEGAQFVLRDGELLTDEYGWHIEGVHIQREASWQREK